ncbi:hypothetical protein [Salibacterium qingdaonense]|uniref:Uncharacterized protein n=1 Tax=Salibacterium qingdaonense TaxID=266892 RepID=A0A1I4PJ92_9BACI|nr:hypothetical protein [Salibacterium qingdaonense]SFM27503.1 hypothetical protein SAMN04488054_1273 [Salibacterium qingdaonense]
MNKSDGYTKFQVGFHIFIVLIALGIIASYALNDFQVSYVIIGSVIAIGSIYQLYKLIKNTKSVNEKSD